ncbi:MAG TPA: polysaccharide deacetylase family protein [Aggregatilineales bacterium]|nr:polysaccharide deacetylase family protein [Aggregatilineales bacterium]
MIRYALAARVVLVSLTAGIILFGTPHPASAIPGHPPRPSRPFTVYLGFDDGPMYGRTDKILDTLKRYNVHATFFIQGNHATSGAALVAREIVEGHHVGNHLWYHEDLVIATNHPKDDVLLNRYTMTQDVIYRALGNDLWMRFNREEPIKPFRWPGGAVKAFPRPDVITYNWNVTAGDDVVGGARVSQVVNSVLYGDPPNHIYGVYAWGDGAVVLLHDTSRATVRALPLIIENLLAHGVTFGVLPRAGDKPATMPIRIGDVPECAHRPGDCGRQNSMGH